MKLLYEAILKAVEAEQKAAQVDPENSMFATAAIEPPQYVDLYDGQPEIPEQFEFICPALFIEYAIEWTKTGSVRMGTLTLTVHVLTDAMEDTHLINQLPTGFQKIDYYETVVNMLEGLETAETSGLILTHERPVTTDYFNYHELTFTCQISRKANDIRRYVDGTIEAIPIKGNIKERKTYNIP